MRYQSKPQYSEFLMPPEETFIAKPSEQSQTTPQKEDKKEAEFQYNIELVCSSAEVRHYKIKSFLLASTDQETTANTSWSESPNQDSTGIILTTSVYVNEPKALHYQFAGTKSTAFSYEDVKPVKKGDISHTESFIPVKPSVQIGERLGWPTEGYFYHFIDDEFVHEYKIKGSDRWAFSATESTKESLSDSLLPSQLTTILLPWKINGKTIDRQHLLFKKEKITKELLDNEINPDWLDEHACLLNMRDIAATRTVPILDTEKQEGDNIIYVIKAGDTLSKIANRHGITLGKLIELNPKYKNNPNAINVGEKITIETKQEATPQLEFHVCQIDPETNQRETWSQIAAKYSLAPKELLELNKHYDSDPIALAVGDKLNVKTKSQDITTPEKRNTLPAEDVTTNKTVYAFSNAQCTASDKTHFNVLPIIDLGQADKNTPVIKTSKIVLKSKLLSNSDVLELLAKDKGTLIKEGSKGSEVKAIQKTLTALDFELGITEPTENFGPMTEQVLTLFQKIYEPSHKTHADYSIGSADGIVGKNTLLALDEALQDGWSCIRYELRISRKKLYRRHSSINDFVGNKNKDLTVRAKQGGTLGEFKFVDLYNNDKVLLEGVTLEADDYKPTESGSDSYVPTGTYRMIDNPGAKWMPYRLVHTNKKDAKEAFGTRRTINIHKGNYPWNIEGCILLGKKNTSTTAMDKAQENNDGTKTLHSGFEFPKIGPSGIIMDKFIKEINDIQNLSTQVKLKTYDGSSAIYKENFYPQLKVTITDTEMNDIYEYSSGDNEKKYTLITDEN